MTARYCKRVSLFQRDESEWRAEPEVLVRRDPAGVETHLKWADVRWVRLRYNPSLVKPWMHIFTVATSRERMTINNAHFVWIGRFEDRSAEYSAFVRDALSRIAVLSPAAAVRLGSSPLSFVAQTGFLGLMLIGLAIVLIVMPAPTVSVSMVVKLLIMAASVPLVILWMKTNWPRRGSLSRAAELLPGGERGR